MKVLFVGLGTMGRPMARNLSTRDDIELLVNDAVREVTHQVAEDLSATAVESLADIPEDVETTILMLPNSAIVESIVEGPEGLLSRLESGSLLMDMGSSEPASSQRLAGLAEMRGIDYVDAPVSGGLIKAKSGELSIMAGGSASAFERAEPLLQSMGAAVFHVGPAGSGDAAKALNNLLSATNIMAAAEVISAAARFGVEPTTMIDVLNASTGRSQASEVKYPRHILTGTFDSGFAYDLMLKDLGISSTLTQGGLSPVTDAARGVADNLRSTLGERPDHTELVRFYEEEPSPRIRHNQKED